jgi:hypothetical protein
MEAVKLMSKLAARTTQVKALRFQRRLLLNTCKDFVFLEKTSMTKKQVKLRIANTKNIIAKVEADY